MPADLRPFLSAASALSQGVPSLVPLLKSEEPAQRVRACQALETAAACGVRIRPPRSGDPALAAVPDPVDHAPESFDALMASWFPLTYVLNNLNRGLGLPDAYPFVLSVPVVEKLRFVHDTVWAQR